MKQPNIVFILADDTGYGDVNCYNSDSQIPTPNIDRLASEGTMFTDAHSPCALCTPTRYGLLTGRYYWRTPKGHSLVMPYEPPVIEPDRVTLGSMLKKQGYTTAYIGKWHLGLRYPARAGENTTYTQTESLVDFSKTLDGGPVDLGFDYFFGTAGCSTSDSPYCFIENDRTVGIPSVPSTEALHKLPGFYPGLMVPDWSEEDVDPTFVEKAKQFIDIHVGGEPFFLYLALSAPHNPWLPPDFVKGKSKEGPRGDMNVLVDWCVGEIYNDLETRHILDDTLFIFTSDNGPMRGENGHRSAGFLRGFKNTAFEGGHRIPFIARWPDHVPKSAKSDEPISLTDMFATTADLTGFEMPYESGEDSFSVLPAILGRGVADPGRPAMIHDTGGFTAKVGDFAVRSGRWKLILKAPREDDPPGMEPLRFLFDLNADPYEQTNVIDMYPSIARELGYLFSKIRTTGSRHLKRRI